MWEAESISVKLPELVKVNFFNRRRAVEENIRSRNYANIMIKQIKRYVLDPFKSDYVPAVKKRVAKQQGLDPQKVLDNEEILKQGAIRRSRDYDGRRIEVCQCWREVGHGRLSD